MTPAETRAHMLAHCLALADMGAENAVWMADWYERNEPWLLTNLGAKVRQEIARREKAKQAARAE